MLIKTADEKTINVSLLEALLQESSGSQRAQIEEELRFLKAGLRAERDAAYLIDFDFRDSKNTAVLHDLRLEINGRVAQIDHLLIHRSLNVFVIETKSFHAGLKITEDGEFLRWNDWKKTFEGMPSPLAQNNRHVTVLKDAFDQIDMPIRLGLRLAPRFHSVIAVDPKARIDRPKKFDTSQVIKADMLSEFVQKTLEHQNALGLLAKLIGTETLEQLARNLADLHRPVVIDYRAKFGLPVASKPQSDDKPEGSSTELLAPVCRTCGSIKITIQYGKYGYYFKCADCGGNTPIRIGCGRDGHKERIRKDGKMFFRECTECGTSSLFFENRP